MMKFFSLLLSLIWLLSCSGSQLESRQKEIILYDVKYGTDSLQTMDVYLPANRSPKTPFVINIHGGAWMMGDKADDHPFCQYLLSRNIAVANLNYRLANNSGIHLPEMLDDVDSAFLFITSKSKDWNTRNTDFSLTGMSSGAHQALMSAYTRQNSVKTLVERAGVTDLIHPEMLDYISKNNLTGLIDLMSGSEENWKIGDAHPPLYEEFSPAVHIKNIPILILHGDADDVVPVYQAYSLENKLKEKKYPYEMKIVPNAGHDFEENENTKEFVFKSAADWFLKYGK